MGLSRLVTGGVVAGLVLFACANLDGLAGGAAPAAGLDGGGKTPSLEAGAGGVDGGPATTVGGVTIAPGSLDFTKSPCGTKQSAKITLTNPTGAAVPYTFAVPASGVFAVDGADSSGNVSGSVPPNGTATLAVNATSNAPGGSSDSLVGTVGGEPASVALSIETTGVALSFGPAVVDFGAIHENTTSQPIAVTVQNDGDREVVIDAFKGASDFGLPTSLLVQAGASISATVTMKAGTAGSPIDEHAQPVFQTDNVFCGPAPALELKGQRVSTNVTVAPGTVDFGKVTCGSDPPAAKTITVSNYSTANGATYAAVLPANSHFAFPASGSGSVGTAAPPSTPATASFSVALKATGTTPGVYSEQMNVTVTSASGGSTVAPVLLQTTVTGAAITLNPPSVTIAEKGGSTKTTVQNIGNVTVCLQANSSSPGFVLTPSKLTLPPMGGTTLQVNASAASGAKSSTISFQSVSCGFTAPATVCGTLPTLSVSAP